MANEEIVLCKMFTGNYWEDENNLGYETINMFLPDGEGARIERGEEPISYMYLPADGDYKLKDHNPQYIILTQLISGKSGELCVKALGCAKIVEELFKEDVDSSDIYECIKGGHNFDIMTFLWSKFQGEQINITDSLIEELQKKYDDVPKDKATGYVEDIKNSISPHTDLEKKLKILYERSRVLQEAHQKQTERVKRDGIAYNRLSIMDIFANNSSFGDLNILTTFKVQGLKLFKENVYLTNHKTKFEYLKKIGKVFYINSPKLSSSSQGTFIEKEQFKLENLSENIKEIFYEDFIKCIESEYAKELNINQFEKGLQPSFFTRIKKEYDELSYSNLIAYFFSISPNFLKFFFECVETEDNGTLKLDIQGVVSSSQKITDKKWEKITGSLKLGKVQREKKNIDIIIKGEKDVIIIENKLKSALNGKPEKDINGDFVKNQLKKYYTYIEEEYKNENKTYLIFAPNYNPIDKENFGKIELDEKETAMKKVWKIVRYSEVLNRFSKYTDYKNDPNFSKHDKWLYKEFLKALSVHAQAGLKNYHREMQIRMRKLFN